MAFWPCTKPCHLRKPGPAVEGRWSGSVVFTWRASSVSRSLPKFPKINGLTGNESNQYSAGTAVQVSNDADYRGQLSHDPDHHFPGRRCANLRRRTVRTGPPGHNGRLCKELRDAKPEHPGLARNHEVLRAGEHSGFNLAGDGLRVFKGWFSSISGPTICNRAFAHTARHSGTWT